MKTRSTQAPFTPNQQRLRHAGLAARNLVTGPLKAVGTPFATVAGLLIPVGKFFQMSPPFEEQTIKDPLLGPAIGGAAIKDAIDFSLHVLGTVAPKTADRAITAMNNSIVATTRRWNEDKFDSALDLYFEQPAGAPNKPEYMRGRWYAEKLLNDGSEGR